MNPSFEDTFTCVHYDSLLLNNSTQFVTECPVWYIPSVSSPDYFNMSPSVYCQYPIDSNFPLGFQLPHIGNGYFGFGFYGVYMFPDWGREFLTGTFLTSLIQGHNYYVSFFVSPCDSCKYLTSDIGAYLSVDSVKYYDTSSYIPLPLNPQIENPSGNIINNFNGWSKIDGYYIALGGEKYITIGCFKNDANIILDSSTIFTPYGSESGYMFLDDVSVIDCTTTRINEYEIDGLIELYPNPFRKTFSIQMPSTIQLEQTEIFNVTGAKIFESKLQKEIDVGVLPKGVYILGIKTNKGFVHKKLIKQ